jgi:hypothetical protein
VLVDRELSGLLKPLTDEFRIRRARTTSVRGYTRLESWTLRRPKPPRKDKDERATARSDDTRASRRTRTTATAGRAKS